MPKELYVRKRDNSVVPFDRTKIESAINRCAKTLSNPLPYSSVIVTDRVIEQLETIPQMIVDVETIQNFVIESFTFYGMVEAKQSYQSYRQLHAEERMNKPVPSHVKKAFDESAAYFKTPLQQFQYYDKYARYNYDYGRRETWVETVDRAVDYLAELSEYKLPVEDYNIIREAILNMEVMPSMRLLAMAGEATRRNNLCLYNCSFMTVSSIDAFVECLIISMNGCGVGYSVERKNVEKLPAVEPERISFASISRGYRTFVVPDTTEGWAEALRLGIETWFDGRDVYFDYSDIREAGAPLKVKGGRASGYKPLQTMLNKVREIIRNAAGRKLTPLECHDIMCHVGEASIAGGVRRTALISLFDYDDEEMLHCKDGEFWIENPQRTNANNSAVWPESGITREQLDNQMNAMYSAFSGEPGIFNRQAARNLAPSRRNKELIEGTNPCGEIVLRDMQLCNLSAVVARADDTFASLSRKIQIASLIGTIQSMATNFPGLRPEWQQNCEEERLLGVDITGQMDCPVLQEPGVLIALKEAAIEANRFYAEILGINQSAAVTCVKPSGNTSVLADCSSGLHARYAKYYIRRVRLSATSPVLRILRNAGIPIVPEVGQTEENATKFVATFYVKAPEGAITRDMLTVTDQLEWWKRNKLEYTEHNPSVSIYYEEWEKETLTEWVWQNKDIIGGMAFLPKDHSDSSLYLLPYQEISENEYLEAIKDFPAQLDFSKLFRIESEDFTEAAQTIACLANGGQDC